MFKLSKESKITFLGLLIIPIIWIIVNHFGLIDSWKTKSIDLRLSSVIPGSRGEISHQSAAPEEIEIEGNQTIPKVPKIVYVNFDAATLAMDDVGERPWDRAFFRDMSMALMKKGGARVLAFDFGFTPKSMSKMVPMENSYRSDSAMGELIKSYPDQVVLGCLYSGVPTSFVKITGASAFPPLFKDGYSHESAMRSSKFNYPESPTYPLQNYLNGRYMGRTGSFTVPPYRYGFPGENKPAVDNIPRWVPLWFPGGGKAHAYNLLGGKQSKLPFEMLGENKEEYSALQTELKILSVQKSEVLKQLDPFKPKISKQVEKIKLAKKNYNLLIADLSIYQELSDSVKNFSSTLKANPALSAVIQPQIDSRQEKINEFFQSLLARRSSGEMSQNEIVEIEEQIKELERTILNLESTLSANPSISGIIQPQIDLKNNEVLSLRQSLPTRSFNFKKARAELKNQNDVLTNLKTALKANPVLSTVLKPQIDAKENEIKAISEEISAANESSITVMSSKEQNQMINRLKIEVKEKSKHLESLAIDLNATSTEMNSLQEKFDHLSSIESIKRVRINRIEGKASTELVETNSTLRLVYTRALGDEGIGELVDSFPNELPLLRNRPVYTLGVESLLAYYGLDHQHVKISEDNLRFTIIGRDGTPIIDAPLEEKQFLEVNWFSGWSEKLPEKILVMEAKRAYGDDDFDQYLSLVPKILKIFLSKLKDIELPEDPSNYPDLMSTIGIEEVEVQIARKLLAKQIPVNEIPPFDDFMSVIEAISYYFIPTSLESKYNPMCGMRDVIQNSRFLEQVKSSMLSIEEQIEKLEGPTVLGAISNALKQNPKNQKLLNQKNQVEEAIVTNKTNLATQQEELLRIQDFFSRFNNAIVLIGPEEATFQDLAPTPFDKSSAPKVGVHGNLIKTLTSGLYIKRLGKEIDHAATLGVGLIMALLAVYQGSRSSWVQAGGIVLLLGYIFFGFVTFSNSHVVLPITAPACAGISTSFIGLAIMVVIEQKAKGRLKGMFGSYVSSELVDQMVESGEEPSLGGQETAITAFFSDVQAFSSFSELLSPTGLVDLMNEYLTAMTNILQEERGTLDKYIGDAIVAMYGAPIPMKDHAYQSVKTAILMQQEQIKLREKWSYEEDKWGKCHGLVSKMQTRIGCNTGTATVGNMGALDRFNYTMMGDMVNLAARCESGAKAYGAYIMITEETKLASEKTRDDIAFRYLDRIVVKGRKQPVAMFEPTGFMSELTQETQDCLDCFKQGIDKYLLQDWDGALGMFEKAKTLEPNKPGVTPGVADNPSIILIDRCNIMKENPPGSDWDGVYVMTSK